MLSSGLASVSMLALALASVFVSVFASGADAAIVYQSQTRSVSANAYAFGGVSSSQSFGAPDFGVFNRSANASAFGGNYGSGVGRQNSSLTALGVSAVGGWGGSGHVLPPSAGGGGSSIFSVVFTLDEPTNFTLTTSGLQFLDSEASFSFASTDAGSLHLTVAPISLAGILPPGSYRLAASVNGNRSYPAGGNEFSIQLGIPSPGPIALIMPAAAVCVFQRKRR